MLVASDPPRQRQLRHIVHKVFGPEYVERVTARVRGLTDAAIDRAVAAGGCDFAVDVAPEMPAGALMEIMGVSYTQAHELIGLTRRMIGFRDPFFVDQDDEERLRLAIIQAEIFDYFGDLLAERRAKPGDDLLSVLLTATVNGRPLLEEDIYYDCINVAVGGNETSSYSACAGVLALMDSSEQRELLFSQPGLLPAALNEILRWSSTNAYVQRVATRAVALRGREIAAGDSVTLWNVSANRDEAHFPAADRFVVSRTPNRHLSYGAGTHRCIGAPTAAAELSGVFEEIVGRRVCMTRSGPVTRLRSNFIQGITSLPVEITDGRSR
jgi:cytochrome P450